MATRILDLRTGEQRSTTHCSPNNDRQLVTLLELLRFYAETYVNTIRCLSKSGENEYLKRRLRDLSTAKETQTDLPDLKLLHGLSGWFGKSGLRVCERHVKELVDTCEHSARTPTQAELEELQANIARELSTRLFLSISPERAPSFDKPRRKWQKVIHAFPDSQTDIEEMNKCFALSRYTAAVFHGLLVVEHGLIALGNYIGVSDPKIGWDATYRELKRLIENRALVPSNLDLTFLEQTKARLDSIKLAWRNKVNHAGGRLLIEKSDFNDESAEEVIIACRSFMRHLAEGLPTII